MNINDFANLVMDGVHPVIEFKKGVVEDFEQYAEPGMRARVNGAAIKHDEWAEFSLDFSEFEAFNQPLEVANYYDKNGNAVLTAHQAGEYVPQDSYSFDLKNDADDYFTVVEDTSLKLYERYKRREWIRSLAIGSDALSWSYVQWLEHFAARHIGI